MHICLCGYGSIGKRHFEIISNLYPDLTYKIYDIKKGFSKIEDIKDEAFDLAVICTPTSSHLDTMTQINAKSYFIEKPLDSDFKKVEEYLPFFINKKTMVSSNLLFSKYMETIKDHIKDASVVNIRYASFLPLWRQDYKDLYCCHSSQGGGVFNDCYPHEIAYVVNLLGQPKNIKINKYRLRDYTYDTDDYSTAVFEYENKIVNFEFSYISQYKLRTCEMFLYSGERFFVDFSGNIELPKQHTVSDIDETYIRQWEHFFSTDKPINSYLDAYNLMKSLNESGK